MTRNDLIWSTWLFLMKAKTPCLCPRWVWLFTFTVLLISFILFYLFLFYLFLFILFSNVCGVIDAMKGLEVLRQAVDLLTTLCCLILSILYEMFSFSDTAEKRTRRHLILPVVRLLWCPYIAGLRRFCWAPACQPKEHSGKHDIRTVKWKRVQRNKGGFGQHTGEDGI